MNRNENTSERAVGTSRLRKPYAAPRLVVHGPVEKITESFGNANSEGGFTGSFFV